jgi:hypothetical protein
LAGKVAVSLGGGNAQWNLGELNVESKNDALLFAA